MTRCSFPRLEAGLRQNEDGIAQVQRGNLEPGGHLALTLSEQGATNADIAEVTARLRRIGELPGAAP
jgi:uncharacterized membrane protein YcaP (DUF421 family)